MRTNPLQYLFLLLLSISSFAQEMSGGMNCALTKQAAFSRSVRLADINYPGDDKIDIGYYHLNLDISHAQKYLKGAATISFKTTTALNRCFLDLRNTMKVDSVLLGNRKLGYIQETSKLNIILDKTYTANQVVTIIVYYQGSPVASAYGSFTFATHGTGIPSPIVWTLSEPYGAPDWFPCKDTPSDKADSSDVWITMPKEFVSVSNGVLNKMLENPNGTRTYQWTNRYPIAHYLISIACTDYIEYKNYYRYSTTDSLEINHFVYPESFSPTVKTQLDQTPFMMGLFSEKYGTYPFLKEKYGHAQCGFGGGMEHQTISSMGNFQPDLVAHELAHQWFGNKITCNGWEHIWLNEGFATFSEAVYAEAAFGNSAYQTIMNDNMLYAKRAKGSLFVKNTAIENEIFNYNRSYAKGAVVVHMLRGILGDEVFYRALQDYMASHLAYGSATTEDFQKIVETSSGINLDYFFKEWVYGEGYPKYTYGWTSGKASDGTSTVSLRITQTQNTSPEYFTMPVELKIITTQGESITTVVVDKSSTEINLSGLKGDVSAVIFDPENKILKDVSEIKIEPNANEPLNKIIKWSVSPNPAISNAQVEFDLKQNTSVIITLYDISGRKIREMPEEKLSAGQYSRNLNLQGLAAGSYVVRITTGNYSHAKLLALR